MCAEARLVLPEHAGVIALSGIELRGALDTIVEIVHAEREYLLFGKCPVRLHARAATFRIEGAYIHAVLVVVGVIAARADQQRQIPVRCGSQVSLDAVDAFFEIRLITEVAVVFIASRGVEHRGFDIGTFAPAVSGSHGAGGIAIAIVVGLIVEAAARVEGTVERAAARVESIACEIAAANRQPAVLALEAEACRAAGRPVRSAAYGNGRL